MVQKANFEGHGWQTEKTDTDGGSVHGIQELRS